MNRGHFISAALILQLVTPAFASYSFTTLYTFSGNDGAGPHATMISDASGNLYGETLAGGPDNDGTVFEIAAQTHQLTTLATFDGANGIHPSGGLVFDSSGDLYGTTEQGGGSNVGTIFELPAGSNTITNLASFNGSNGNEPTCAPVIDANGNLYGTTYSGGLHNDGTVFTLAAGTHSPTTLANFDSTTNGASPGPGLTFDSDGNLYGVTESGGGNNGGTIFELPSGSRSLTTLVSFNAQTTGSRPQCTLVCDANGDLFGGVSVGINGSSVFELSSGSSSPTTLAVLNKATNGLNITGLIRDAEGDLFGTTVDSGPGGGGTVFESPAGTSTVTTLEPFSGAIGSAPFAGLVSDADGNLYGTTFEGAANNDGTVYELSPVAVPEPASFALFAAAGSACLVRPLRRALKPNRN